MIPPPYNGNLFDWDERTSKATQEAAWLYKKTYGWHSVSCACDECLNTDALVGVWGTKVDRISTEGLTA